MVELVTALDGRVYDALDQLAEPRRAGQDDQRGEPTEGAGKAMHRWWCYHGEQALASTPFDEAFQPP